MKDMPVVVWIDRCPSLENNPAARLGWKLFLGMFYNGELMLVKISWQNGRDKAWWVREDTKS
jgi:hypothetical protein